MKTPKMDKIKVTLSISADVKNEAMILAKSLGIPFSYYVELAINDQIRRDNKYNLRGAK